MKNFDVPDEIASRVSHTDMHAAVEAIFDVLGCPRADRLRCADTLLYADLSGIAVPARQQPPFTFDASMSAIAGNKIRIVQRLGSTILPGLLGGDPAGFEREPGDVSHHFLAYRIDAFTDLEPFKDRMDVYLHGLCDTQPAPGQERVIYAGLPEHEAELDRRARGIPYHPDAIEWFRQTADKLGMEQVRL